MVCQWYSLSMVRRHKRLKVWDVYGIVSIPMKSMVCLWHNLSMVRRHKLWQVWAVYGISFLRQEYISYGKYGMCMV